MAAAMVGMMVCLQAGLKVEKKAGESVDSTDDRRVELKAAWSVDAKVARMVAMSAALRVA